MSTTHQQIHKELESLELKLSYAVIKTTNYNGLIDLSSDGIRSLLRRLKDNFKNRYYITYKELMFIKNNYFSYDNLELKAIVDFAGREVTDIYEDDNSWENSNFDSFYEDIGKDRKLFYVGGDEFNLDVIENCHQKIYWLKNNPMFEILTETDNEKVEFFKKPLAESLCQRWLDGLEPMVETNQEQVLEELLGVLKNIK